MIEDGLCMCMKREREARCTCGNAIVGGNRAAWRGFKATRETMGASANLTLTKGTAALVLGGNFQLPEATVNVKSIAT